MYTPFGRNTNRKLGLGLMIVGVFLSMPPGFGIPLDDIVNFWLAKIMASVFPLSFETALFMTYTVLGIGLILIGASIFPYNTGRLLNGKWNKFIGLVKKGFSSCKCFVIMLISLAAFLWMMQWYKKYILEAGL